MPNAILNGIYKRQLALLKCRTAGRMRWFMTSVALRTIDSCYYHFFSCTYHLHQKWEKDFLWGLLLPSPAALCFALEVVDTTVAFTVPLSVMHSHVVFARIFCFCTHSVVVCRAFEEFPLLTGERDYWDFFFKKKQKDYLVRFMV